MRVYPLTIHIQPRSCRQRDQPWRHVWDDGGDAAECRSEKCEVDSEKLERQPRGEAVHDEYLAGTQKNIGNDARERVHHILKEQKGDMGEERKMNSMNESRKNLSEHPQWNMINGSAVLRST